MLAPAAPTPSFVISCKLERGGKRHRWREVTWLEMTHEEREKRKRDEGHKWKVRGCQTTSVIL